MDELFEEYRDSQDFFASHYDGEDLDYFDYDDEVDDAYEM